MILPSIHLFSEHLRCKTMYRNGDIFHLDSDMTFALREAWRHFTIGNTYTNNYDSEQEVIRWESNNSLGKWRLFGAKGIRWHLISFQVHGIWTEGHNPTRQSTTCYKIVRERRICLGTSRQIRLGRLAHYTTLLMENDNFTFQISLVEKNSEESYS